MNNQPNTPINAYSELRITLATAANWTNIATSSPVKGDEMHLKGTPPGCNHLSELPLYHEDLAATQSAYHIIMDNCRSEWVPVTIRTSSLWQAFYAIDAHLRALSKVVIDGNHSAALQFAIQTDGLSSMSSLMLTPETLYYQCFYQYMSSYSGWIGLHPLHKHATIANASPRDKALVLVEFLKSKVNFVKQGG